MMWFISDHCFDVELINVAFGCRPSVNIQLEDATGMAWLMTRIWRELVTISLSGSREGQEGNKDVDSMSHGIYRVNTKK